MVTPQQAAVIPSAGEESLIGDLLSLDLPTNSYNAPPPAAGLTHTHARTHTHTHTHTHTRSTHVYEHVMYLSSDGLGDLDLLGDLSGLQVRMEL